MEDKSTGPGDRTVEPKRKELQRAVAALGHAVAAFNDELDEQGPQETGMHPEDGETYAATIAALVHIAAALTIRSASAEDWPRLRDEFRNTLAAYNGKEIRSADAIAAGTSLINEALASALKDGGADTWPETADEPGSIH